MKLGARILKTGMAVVLALFIAELFELPSPVFAGISAVFAIQPSIYRSYLTVIEQIQGNIIGAVIAISFVLLFGNHFLIIGLAAIIVIMINLRMKNDRTISLSLVTLIVIMYSPSDEFITFAIIRFLTIMLGIFSAFLINLIFIPPKYETKLYSNISSLSNEILRWIRISNRQAADHVLLKKDIESIKDGFIQLDQLYLFYKEERTLIKKHRYAKLRKLVIYRQMITTARKSFEILKKLHHYENHLVDLPEIVAKNLQVKSDELTTNHEQLLLRYIGKAIQIHEEEMEEYETNRQELLLIYKELLKSESDDKIMPNLLQYIAALMDYNEQLEHLEVLMNSFQSFHKTDQEIELPDSTI